ncbi:hypothetical protein BXZ70DRAFT_864202, partial [Cristinia sonorae]
LRDLGLRIQLGHPLHQKCSNPEPAQANMAIIHTNGIHQVAMDYCACDRVGVAGNR